MNANPTNNLNRQQQPSSQILMQNQNNFLKRSDFDSQNAELNSDVKSRIKRENFDKFEDSTISKRRHNIVNKLLESKTTKTNKITLPLSVMKKLKHDKTNIDLKNKEENHINLDPIISWPSITDSDSDKTIYESFYELLENSSNKFNSNIELLDKI